MAATKDTNFILHFDKGSPKSTKECLKMDNLTSQPLADQADFDAKLQDGKLTFVGSIYLGNVADAPPAPATSSSQIATGNCIIMYLGGTPYKICT